MQLQAGNILDIPLIVTEQNPEKLGKTIQELDTKNAVGVYAKTKFSMFVPEVREYLSKSSNIESIVLMGLESHICVEQTAMDLLSTGKYDVHIVADCVLSRTFGDRAMALERLREMGCIVSTSENIIFKLLRDKNHPKFNDVRKLVTSTSVFPECTNKL